MDPATERMLARARARRQKLDAQLKDLGLETSSKRAPLQESNTQFVKVTTEVEVVLNSSDSVQKVNVSPTKVEIHNSGEKENLLKPSGDKQMSDLKKRENDVMLHPDSKPSCVSGLESSPKAERNIRSQLKRLGALYSDEQISSPIHRTENKFAVENECPTKPTKPIARVARLAALADNIKQWEDDLSHPVFNTKGCNNDVKHADVLVPNEEESLGDGKKENSVLKLQQDRSITNRKEITFEQNKQSHGCTSQNVSPKKMVWDEKVLQLLDDVNETASSRSKGSQKSTEKTLSKNNIMVERNERQEYVAGGGAISGTTQRVGDGPTFPVKKCTSDKNTSKFAVNSSPTKGLGSPVKLPPGSPKAGSVLEKASMFESSSPTKKTKDPAELPLSERMALFERNKGEALIPKAAFSMAVPAKYLESGAKKTAYSPEKAKILKANEDQKASGNNSDSNVCNKVLSCKEIFERGVSNDIKDRVVNEQISRQNELDMLRNRWNKNKTLATETEDTKRILPDPVLQNVVPPPPPPPPCDKFSTRSFALPQITHMIPKCSGSNNQSPTKEVHQESPRKPSNLSPKINEKSEVCKIRKIKVSPPKPGHIYPCLSDIDATTTEAESEIGDETERDSDSSVTDDSDTGNTSFGREILEAAGINNKSNNENQRDIPMDSSSSDFSESADMSDIGGCIDEALKGYDSSSESDNEGPTPPKKGRGYLHSPQKGKSSSNSPNSKPSQSFKYTPGSSTNSSPSKSPEKYHRCEVPMESSQETPLMHSVSFYRKQQNLSLKNTPVRQIVRPPETVMKMESEPVSQINEEEAIRMKITELLEEVSKQQIVISQASQALNLCMSTVEFSGSAEQVEGERLLLLATHKRQAALHEVQRLKVEGSLKPVSEADPNASFNRGSLMITNICLSMKKDCVRRLPSEETCYHFMCLVRSQDQVLGTQVLAGIPQNLQDGCNLVWNSPLRLVNLYSDFKVTLEVYSLQTRREILPHNVKYHIGGKKDTGKSWRTPKKQKQESLLVMPAMNSPAGPSAVRSPEFRMAGYVVFSLREINRNHFTLNKVSYSSPLEGSIQVKMKSELSVDVCERGFLTMFEDVSGFGAWHRRWFVLKGSVLAYWKYPDDERKIPIGQIDLDTCSTTYVNLVSRDICARPNTFLLETVRPAHPDDKDSLVMITSGDTTTIRVLLSADTKEERLLWCAQINKALSLIRAWGSK